MIADRALADIRKRDQWSKAREGKIGASDAAKFAKLESVDSYVRAKLLPAWDGNSNAQWGNEREAEILAFFGWEQNHTLFHAIHNGRFVATPDGIKVGHKPMLAQVKTTNKDFRSKRTGEILVPPAYRRQVWWEQLVMGPEFEETIFMWEVYEEVNGQFVPKGLEPESVVIARDEAEIAKLVTIAVEVLRRLDLAQF